MKGILVFMLLVLATAMAARKHTHRANAQGDRINKFAAGLDVVKEHFPPGGSCSFIMPEGAPGDAYILWRYIMAPRYCSIDPSQHFDTVLAICNMNMTDSAVQRLTAGRNVICSSNDGQYKYYLTSTH